MPHRNNRLTHQLLSNNSTAFASQSLLGTPQPPPPAPTPPAASLISDTLTACLDVNGTYLCTSFSPRCYIIQKVTPTSVTVTPATPALTLATQGPLPLYPETLGPGPSDSYQSLSSFPTRGTPNKAQAQPRRPGAGLLNFSPNTSGVGIGPYRVPSYQTSAPGRPAQPNRPYSSHSYHKPHQAHHYYNNGRAGGSGSGSTTTSSSSSSTPGGRARNQNLNPPRTFERAATPFSGGVYMNGEIGPSVRPVSEAGMPTMVYPPSVASVGAHQPGTHFTDTHGSVNGAMMQELYVDGAEVDRAEGSDGKRGGSVQDGNVAHLPLQPGHTPDLPIEELKRMLLSQLEYYFSPENLAVDKYLVTQMDQDHYVPIATLASFNMVKKLTSDIDLVTEVLRESKNVQVHADGQRVRPISHRTVVILRGIPASTNADEIKSLFENENCPKCTGCEFAFNDSWYVSFESDDDAQRAHRYLREDVREFKGQPIMARIKSKPTTLLSQGVAIGVPTIKNGFSSPGTMMPPFLATAPPFVPANQQAATVTTPTSLYTSGQQVPQNVFPAVIPSNYPGFGPWASYFDLNSAALPMFSMNGLPHQTPGYGKPAPMSSRGRNLNSMRGGGPRRTLSTSSDSQGVSGGNNVNGAHQQPTYSNHQQRKNNGASVPALLGMAPQNLVSHHSAQGPSAHHHSNPHNSITHSNNPVSNGRHFANSYPQHVPHMNDNYHYSRPYRGGGDSRPRSSMSSRRNGPRREEDGGYDYTHAPPVNSNYRGNPSIRSNSSANATSQQVQPQISVTNQSHQIDLDLEGSFPPLPGSANPSNKNGDAQFEGRLSDVVKGVRNLKMGNGAWADKDESNEIVVSAADAELSPARLDSPEEVEAFPNRDDSETSSHSKKEKEYREIGVGSADENNEIRSSQPKNGVVGNRQTADKSTRTDDNLLYGDQLNSCGGSNKNSQPLQSSGTTINRKPVSVTSQGGGSKSPVPGKRVPPLPTVSMAVGPDVPYTSSGSSPIKSPAPRGASCVKTQQLQDNNRPGPSAGSPNNSLHSTLEKEAFSTSTFVKVPTPSSSGSSCKSTGDPSSKEAHTDDNLIEAGQGDAKKADNCSNDDGVPVKLSYAAMVAQSRKETSQQQQQLHPPSNSTTISAPITLSASSSTPSISSTQSSPQSSSTVGAHTSTHLSEDKKTRSFKDKDRAQSSRNQRVNTERESTAGRDRDRGFRNRGYRSRVTSDSDAGSHSGNRPNARGPKSPK